MGCHGKTERMCRDEAGWRKQRGPFFREGGVAGTLFFCRGTRVNFHGME